MYSQPTLSLSLLGRLHGYVTSIPRAVLPCRSFQALGCYATGSYTQFVGLSTTSPASATTTSVSPVTSSYTSTITSVSCVSVSTSSASSPSRTSSSILASSTTSGSHTTFSSKATSSVASTPSSTSNTVQSSTSGAIASENHKSSFPVAAVAGGVAGGLVLIAVVAIIAYFCLRRNNDKSPYQPPPVMTQSVPSKPAFGGTTRSNAGTTENGGNFYGTGQLPYAAVPSAPQDYYTPSIPNYANYPYNHNDNADRLYEAPYNGPSEIPYVSSPSYIPASLLPGSLAGGPLYSQGNPALDSAAFGSLGGFVAPHPVDRGSRDLPEAVTIDDRDSRNLSG